MRWRGRPGAGRCARRQGRRTDGARPRPGPNLSFTCILTPRPEPSAGKGPVYLKPDRTADKTLTATSTLGEALFGEVPPGDYEVTFTATGKSCSARNAWASTTPNPVRLKIAPGYQNDILTSCT